jgi:hypothetical protein
VSLWGGFKTLLGAGKTTNDIFDKDNGLLTQAGGWIGSFSFTEQERAEYQAAAAAGVVEYVKMTLSENTTRSKTRRVVAILWIAVELFLVLLTVLVWPISELYAKFVWDVASSTLMISGTLSVIAFFFGPYMIGRHLQRKDS